MNFIAKNLLEKISDLKNLIDIEGSAYNIREDGQCSDCYRLQKSALCTARDEFGCSFRECVALLLAISPRISWFMDNMSCFFTLPK